MIMTFVFQKWFCYMSLAALSVSLLLCLLLAYVSPFLVGLKSAGSSNDPTLGSEFWIVFFLILVEVFLLSKEVRNNSSNSAQNASEAAALHTL